MPTERMRAERTLDLYSGVVSGTEDLDWPACAQRIQAARERAGLTLVEVADRLGISVPAYDDLERYDDEAFTVANLGTLRLLGQLAAVSPARLLLGTDANTDAVTFDHVCRALREHLARHSLTVDEFGDSIGWDVTQLLDQPDHWDEQPVELLYLVCSRVGIDWVAVLGA